jgi:hypothetical protein
MPLPSYRIDLAPLSSSLALRGAAMSPPLFMSQGSMAVTGKRLSKLNPKEGSTVKMLTFSLSLLTLFCLILAAIPVGAQQTLYENGPANGTVDAWTINFGYAVTDSFFMGDDVGGDVRRFGWWTWLCPQCRLSRMK